MTQSDLILRLVEMLLEEKSKDKTNEEGTKSKN